MKKLFYFLSVSAFIFTSCSSDDDSSTPTPTPSSSVLVKKEIETYSDGTSTTYNYTYNGNKIVKISDTDGSVSNFTYTGDLITKVETFEDDLLAYRETYQYNSANKLTKYVDLEIESGYANRILYTHNADGSISYTSYVDDPDGESNFYMDGIYTSSSYLENVIPGGSLPNYSETFTSTYDDKNNPYKNILGYGNMNFADTREGYSLNNNAVMIMKTNSQNNSNITSSASTFTYNAANYPITETEVNDNETTTTQFFYE